MTGITCTYNYPNDNDIYLDASGIIATNSGNDEIIENCCHAIELWLGEYGFNYKLGINWRYYISTNTPVGLNIKANITKTLLEINGVKTVVSFSMELIDRKLLLDINVLLNSGVTATITRSV